MWEKEEIIPQKFANMIKSEGAGTDMLVLDQYDMVCRTKSQFKAVADTALYINQSFTQIKEEFLSVIDHLETSDEEPGNEKKKGA